MLNIYDVSYFYSLIVFNYFKKNNIKFCEWNKCIKLLILISKKKKFYIYYRMNKKKCLKEIFYIINKYITLNKKIVNFIEVIFDDNMFLNINYIYLSLIKIYKKNKDILYVNVFTRNNNLNILNIKKIKIIFRNYFINKRLFFLFKKDKSIIAGFKIYINDLVFDASILNIIQKNIFYKYKN